MLVFSRAKDTGIMIGDDIEIVVIETRYDRARIGINAPKHVPVHRREVWNLRQANGDKSPQVDTPTAWFAVLEAARAAGDVETQAEALRQLERHGVHVDWQAVPEKEAA